MNNDIYCKFCYVYQEWKNQEKCISCGHHISLWHVAGQLRGQADAQIGNVAPPQTNSRFDQR